MSNPGDQDGLPPQADVVFVGAFTRYLVLTDRGERLTVVQQSNGTPRGRGERVVVGWRDEDAFQLPGEGR